MTLRLLSILPGILLASLFSHCLKQGPSRPRAPPAGAGIVLWHLEALLPSSIPVAPILLLDAEGSPARTFAWGDAAPIIAQWPDGWEPR